MFEPTLVSVGPKMWRKIEILVKNWKPYEVNFDPKYQRLRSFSADATDCFGMVYGQPLRGS